MLFKLLCNGTFICSLILILCNIMTIVYYMVPHINYHILTKNLNCSLVQEPLYAGYMCDIYCTPECINIENAQSCEQLQDEYNDLSPIQCNIDTCPIVPINMTCSNGKHCCNNDCSLYVENHKCQVKCNYKYTVIHNVTYYVNDHKYDEQFKLCYSEDYDYFVDCVNSWENYWCFYDTDFYIVNVYTDRRTYTGAIVGATIIFFILSMLCCVFILGTCHDINLEIEQRKYIQNREQEQIIVNYSGYMNSV